MEREQQEELHVFAIVLLHKAGGQAVITEEDLQGFWEKYGQSKLGIYAEPYGAGGRKYTIRTVEEEDAEVSSDEP